MNWLKPGALRRAVGSTIAILARAALNLCIVHAAPTAWCVLARRRLCLRLATADLLPANAEGVRLPHSIYPFRNGRIFYLFFRLRAVVRSRYIYMQICSNA